MNYSNKKNKPIKVDKSTILVDKQGPNDLSERLQFDELNKGIIRIDEAIDEFNTSDYMRQIGYVVNSGVKTIKIYITSPGGSVYHSLALYDKLMSLKNVGIKTEAYVEGMAASAASMIILQAIQKRYGTANSRYLIHEPRRWVMFARETVSNLQDETQEMVKLGDIVYNIMAKRTKVSKQELAKLITRKETWLSAQEAKKIGLIDAII